MMTALPAILAMVFVGNAYGEESEYAWAWNETEGYYKVYYYSVNDYSETDRCMEDWQGCEIKWYMNDRIIHEVILLEDREFMDTEAGCNTYTHEMLHAWGFQEQTIRQFFSCNPVISFSNMTLPHAGFWK